MEGGSGEEYVEKISTKRIDGVSMISTALFTGDSTHPITHTPRTSLEVPRKCRSSLGSPLKRRGFGQNFKRQHQTVNI